MLLYFCNSAFKQDNLALQRCINAFIVIISVRERNKEIFFLSIVMTSFGQPKLLYHNGGIIQKNNKLQTNIFVQKHTIYKINWGIFYGGFPKNDIFHIHTFSHDYVFINVIEHINPKINIKKHTNTRCPKM